ncbi:MAG TPA: hypothetical protein VGF38_16335 [Ktedonobacterales bacterium]|jgi:hypothetical protein
MSNKQSGEGMSPVSALEMSADGTLPRATPASSAALTEKPRHPPLALRYMRLLSGLLLLAVASGGIIIELALATNLREGPSQLVPASLHAVLLVTLDSIAGLWLLAVVLGCLLLGVMSLVLVFIRREW